MHDELTNFDATESDCDLFTFRDPPPTICRDGMFEPVMRTVLEELPQNPKKLHSDTRNVYSCPTAKYVGRMESGREG